MSTLSLLNTTPFVAQFTIKKGDQVIARLPGIAPGASLQVPSDNQYEVAAATAIDGNTYTTAVTHFDSAMEFLAQVRQVRAQGTYAFELLAQPSSVPNTLVFQKTTLNPVTFTLSKTGIALQNVVVVDSFTAKTLQLDDTYSVYAVINGITTDTVQTTNPQATLTATVDTSEFEAGYFSIAVS